VVSEVLHSSILWVGCAGLLLSCLMVRGRERVGGGDVKLSGAESDHASLKESLSFLLARWRAYGALFFGVSVVTLVGYGAFWVPALFARTWGWSIVEVSLGYGMVLLIFGPLGAWLSGELTSRLIDRGVKEGPYMAMLIGVMILIPAAVAFPLMPTGELALAVACIMTIGGALPSAAGASSLVYIAPNQVRATGTAIYWMVINLIALFLGPTSVGWITDNVFEDPNKLYLSMAIVPGVCGVVSFVIILWGRKHYCAAVDEAKAWDSV